MVQNIYHTPHIDSNLLSTTIIIDKGFDIIMSKGEINIFKQNKLFAMTIREGNLFKLDLDFDLSTKIANYVTINNDLTTWHHQLGHISLKNIQLLAKRMATGINILTNLNLNLYQYCIYEEQYKQPLNHPASRATKLLKLIHTDICGSMNTISIRGAKFFLLF